MQGAECPGAAAPATTQGPTWWRARKEEPEGQQQNKGEVSPWATSSTFALCPADLSNSGGNELS